MGRVVSSLEVLTMSFPNVFFTLSYQQNHSMIGIVPQLALENKEVPLCLTRVIDP